MVEYFKKAKITHVFGIPGHGNAALVDQLVDYAEDMRFIPVKHEQWGGHMADGYFRANRKTPAIVTTSVGPGSTNLSTALATAYVDSSTFIALTGDIQTYLFGMGIFQEIERQSPVDYINAMKHLCKRTWLVTNSKQLPHALINAHKEAITGRPGPVLIDIPMDIQIEKISGAVPDAPTLPGRIYPDPEAIRKAAHLLINAEKPLILIGGGVTMSDASDELVKVAQFLGSPVACSFRGDAKGGFPEDHDLFVYSPGNVGSSVANKLATEADVILAIGVTFSDETTSSYAPGVSFNIPPTKLIHMDIDAHEIGKNYPTEIAIQSDAKAGLKELYETLTNLGIRNTEDYHNSAHFKHVKELREKFLLDIEEMRQKSPMGIPNVVRILRDALPRDAIISVSAGLPQEIMSQLWLSYEPRTFLSSGGYSTMGFAFPASMGAKLARPKNVSVAVEGDGSFMMNNVELLTAVQLSLPVMVVILNNYGWISIRDLQIRNFAGRVISTDFKDIKGNVRSPDFEKIVKGYGAEYYRAENPQELAQAVSKGMKIEGPVVVEALVENKFPYSGPKSYGFWDLPKLDS